MNNLVHLPNADKIISLDDVNRAEKKDKPGFAWSPNYYSIEITPKSDLVPPKLLYDTEEQMNEDFNVIVNSLNKGDLKNKMEEFLAKYWFDNEYYYIDKKDFKKSKESREKFTKWFEENVNDFL